jgi:hypothetical protein
MAAQAAVVVVLLLAALWGQVIHPQPHLARVPMADSEIPVVTMQVEVEVVLLRLVAPVLDLPMAKAAPVVTELLVL